MGGSLGGVSMKRIRRPWVILHGLADICPAARPPICDASPNHRKRPARPSPSEGRTVQRVAANDLDLEWATTLLGSNEHEVKGRNDGLTCHPHKSVAWLKPGHGTFATGCYLGHDRTNGEQAHSQQTLITRHIDEPEAKRHRGGW
jgi:hypothetical protein